MTSPPTLTDLADRVETLTGQCRETDLAISVAINFKGVFDRDREWKWSVMADDIEGHKDGKKSFLDPAQFVPRWTYSLDAAMTLEVERWWLTLDRFLMLDDPTRYPLNAKTWRVWLKRFVGDLEGDAPCYQQRILATGPTLPIALTAGWLRARSSMEADLD